MQHLARRDACHAEAVPTSTRPSAEDALRLAERRFLAPAAFIGFIYNFGDGTQRRRPEPTFEFEQGGGAPPG